MTAKPIDINDAIAYAKKWQGENKNHAKAFLIPANDLIACLIEMEVLTDDGTGKYILKNVNDSGVRAYMAIKRPDGDPPTPQTEKLLIVGTKADCNGIHRDIIEGEKPSSCPGKEVDKMVAKLAGSGVYDFTDPCPNYCDTDSPLNNP